MNSGHVPVLLKETLELLDPQPGDAVLDGTLGGGGHARALLERIGPGGTLVGLDRDPEALRRAAEVLPAERPNCHLRHADFAEFPRVLDELRVAAVDAAVLDLGVSSFQIDEAERGFSFQQDAPLDMRMDPGQPTTAADLVNSLGQQELADLLYQYGEERNSRRIARRIVEARREAPIRTTGELARIVLGARSGRHRGQWQRIHPATRVFQALRIAVNGELDSLEAFCDRIAGRLAPGGRVAVISFHSLEDRIVKRAFRKMAADGVAELLTKKPVTAGGAERHRNPRSRSAKLRAARRVADA